MENIIYFLVFIYFMYCQDEMLWYQTEKYYCKKNKVNCENCDCWSCSKQRIKEEAE